MENRLSRRSLLAGLGAFGLAKAIPAQSAPASSLRLAFLTDMHILDAAVRSDEGIAFALDHAMKQAQKPELIITGGDNLTGTMGRDFEGAMGMRKRWEKAFRDAVKVPVLHCAGNHDHWGWNKPNSRSTGSEPLWGKAFARDMLGLDRLYYSTERGGWKIIVLDSVQPFENGYIGGIDDAQMEWLKGEVKTTKPTLVVSHIPITGISPLIVDGTPDENHHRVPFGSAVKNMYDVVRLFDDHDNVKLVLSGHIHFEERVSFGGTTYLNGGAVSGAWWLTPAADAQRREQRNPGPVPRLNRAASGYTMIDLFADGRFEAEQVATGWAAATSR